MLRQIMLAAVALATLTGGTLSAEAISLGGTTAPLEKFESTTESQSKGKPCVCVVPPEITNAAAPVPMAGKYRTPIVVADDYVIVPIGHGCIGATCYRIGVAVESAVCDVSVFEPYTSIRSVLYSCDQAGQ
jgi:hypothetical protein